MFTYRGHRIKRSGASSKQEVVCYPRNCTSSSNSSEQYTPAIIPSDLLHVRVGVSPAPGAVLTLHALPPHLLLALAYIELLTSQPSVPAAVLLHATELLGGYLWRSSVPALVKEYVFHLLAECLRVLGDAYGTLPTFSPKLSPTAALLQLLPAELRHLYEAESRFQQQPRFSTYLQALLEVCLATAEVSASQMEQSSSPDATASSPDVGILPHAAATAAKRKKLKAKRERCTTATAIATALKHSASPKRTVSESELDFTVTSGLSISDSKPEEMLWFHRAVTMSQILRYLIRNDGKGEAATADAINDAAQSLHEITAYSRLLVLSGIPTSLPEDTVHSTIQHACSAYGGLYKDELFLPVEELEIMDMSPDGGQLLAAAPSDDAANLPVECRMLRQLQGCAVLELCTRAKVELARHAFTKNTTLLDGLSSGQQPDTAMPDQTLSISAVNQSLLAEPPANAALETYLYSKLVLRAGELSDGLVIALTEIFHSCFMSEQRVSVDPRHESGYICLGREQIMQASANLMYNFFMAVKPAKKAFHEHVKDVLRRYGVPKVMDKDE